MKIILSRKGFDASYGGFPSPVFEDGKMISLPIPTIDKQEASITYDDLSPLGVNLGSLFKKLGKEPKIYNKVAKYVHLDPDLYQDSLKPNNKFRARLDGWRGLFGTNMAAAGKLNDKDTGVIEQIWLLLESSMTRIPESILETYFCSLVGLTMS